MFSLNKREGGSEREREESLFFLEVEIKESYTSHKTNLNDRKKNLLLYYLLFKSNLVYENPHKKNVSLQNRKTGLCFC